MAVAPQQRVRYFATAYKKKKKKKKDFVERTSTKNKSNLRRIRTQQAKPVTTRLASGSLTHRRHPKVLVED